MNDRISRHILDSTAAESVSRGEVIASLWSGYGEIVRMHLEGAAVETVVLKHVRFPTERHHPRGWHSDLGHQRKATSYEVEMAWYHDFSSRCGDGCRVPKCYASETMGEEHLMVLEDLDAVGFPLRKFCLSKPEAELCLKWLANFHATFLGEAPESLWPVGTYWHLATRPDELLATEDTSIRKAAPAIDAMLSGCRYQSLVHGDAKVANFCFSEDAEAVAAVDFQYVGGGCGMKDVAYFLGSCLDEMLQERWESEFLDLYFAELRKVLLEQERGVDLDALEREWRGMFPIAQADFYRFLVGWMPTHWKINDYGKSVALRVVRQINDKSV
ncbi:MAG TPA: oxidoreductase family protein [Mariprofundaceae bacterium]|nr:oxidoreductase family protein [Mariprofundaceae bacterium]